MTAVKYQYHTSAGAVHCYKDAWHFVGDTLRDGQPVPPDGEWLEHKGVMRLCASGLHGSKLPVQALRYAPGPVLCLCDVEDVGEYAQDKFVARRRKIKQRIDMTKHFDHFTRRLLLAMIDGYKLSVPPVITWYLETKDRHAEEIVRTKIVDTLSLPNTCYWETRLFYRALDIYIDHPATTALKKAMNLNGEIMEQFADRDEVPPSELWPRNVETYLNDEIIALFGLAPPKFK